MNITAKVLIPNKSWLVNDGRNKIATLNRENSGYRLVSSGQTFQVDTLNEIKERFGIVIPDETIQQETQTFSPENEIYGYPTKGIPTNPLWDVKKKLPIFTKTSRSKCFFCAGYYAVKFSKIWIRSFCPKLITVSRYPYIGPFKTEEEAKNMINSLNRETNNE
jgi:hypothetical protein